MRYDPQFRAHLAAVIAGGLISTHGVDHGGVEHEVIAQRSVAIADSIIAACDQPEQLNPVPESVPKQVNPTPAPQELVNVPARGRGKLSSIE
jgi:hypothetical protein